MHGVTVGVRERLPTPDMDPSVGGPTRQAGAAPAWAAPAHRCTALGYQCVYKLEKESLKNHAQAAVIEGPCTKVRHRSPGR